MKISEERKQSIILYLLEKIQQGDSGISKAVSEAFEINQATVHSYMKELLEKNIIKKVKRGQYELLCQRYTYDLSRSNGDLNSDTYAYNKYLFPHIKHLPKNVLEIWSYAFSEMINNVMDHSEAQEAVVIIEQTYLSTDVLIADNGIGIFEKIQKHFELVSTEDAICELFKGKLTTDSQNHSGEGIFFSSKMMDNFFIISSGKIFTNNVYDDSRILDIAESEENGTYVIMELSNFSNKTAREVFDQYSNIDGGFFKTTLPLKNIFDTSPVSRSQAKRVCNRLEKFKEVIIDFEDIEWIGQGFAHQLFIVFARNHEDISITPIHMNEDVTKMYNHVIMTE